MKTWHMVVASLTGIVFIIGLGAGTLIKADERYILGDYYTEHQTYQEESAAQRLRQLQLSHNYDFCTLQVNDIFTQLAYYDGISLGDHTAAELRSIGNLEMMLNEAQQCVIDTLQELRGLLVKTDANA